MGGLKWMDVDESWMQAPSVSAPANTAAPAAKKDDDDDDCDLFGDDDEEEETKRPHRRWLPARRQGPRPRRRRLPLSVSPPLSSTSSLRALTVTTMMKTLVEPSTSKTSSHS